jgi:hypothetical protein
MEVVDKLYNGYGEGAPDGHGPDQGLIGSRGHAYLEKGFPKLDTIKSATLVPAALRRRAPRGEVIALRAIKIRRTSFQRLGEPFCKKSIPILIRSNSQYGFSRTRKEGSCRQEESGALESVRAVSLDSREMARNRPGHRCVLRQSAACLIHFLWNGRYGYFRDELYYAACGQHLAWGYVDHAPLIAAIARVSRTLFGDSLHALRFFPALSAGAKILLTAWIVRELGGAVTRKFSPPRRCWYARFT